MRHKTMATDEWNLNIYVFGILRNILITFKCVKSERV